MSLTLNAIPMSARKTTKAFRTAARPFKVYFFGSGSVMGASTAISSPARRTTRIAKVTTDERIVDTSDSFSPSNHPPRQRSQGGRIAHAKDDKKRPAEASRILI